MTVEQNKNIELKTESFVEGYSGENESVVDAKEVDRTPEVVIIEETGTPKNPQSNVKPSNQKSSSTHLGFPWPEELDSEKEEDTKPSLLGFFSPRKKCGSSSRWGCEWAEAERKRAA